jgi:hypothetical protein
LIQALNNPDQDLIAHYLLEQIARKEYAASNPPSFDVHPAHRDPNPAPRKQLPRQWMIWAEKPKTLHAEEHSELAAKLKRTRVPAFRVEQITSRELWEHVQRICKENNVKLQLMHSTSLGNGNISLSTREMSLWEWLEIALAMMDLDFFVRGDEVSVVARD